MKTCCHNTIRYASDPSLFVEIYDHSTVTRSFYNFIWDQMSKLLLATTSERPFSIDEALDYDIWDLLSHEGRATAQKCLEHMAIEKLLPLVFKGKNGRGKSLFVQN